MIRRDRCGHSRIGRRVAVVACGALAAAAVLGTAALAAPPTNDRFAAAQTLTGESGSAGGTTVDATRETGEPEHGDDATGRTVWYRWTAPVSATTAFETCGAARFDTILAAYVGADLAATTQVASNDDSCANQSRIVFDATAGTTYSLAVDGYDGEAGAFTL